MADKAHIETDKRLEEMERHLSTIYSRAGKEVQATADAYFEKFKALDAKKRKLVEAGKLDPDEYKRWRQNKILYAGRFTDLKEQLAQELLNANKTAVDYINDQLPEVYALNYNALESTVDGLGGYSFTLIDPDTVRHLATTDTSLLPFKELDPAKDIPWNMKKINGEVLQGILQGESIPKIAARIANVQAMNENAAVRTARTIVTEAENKGRQDSYERAQADGIQLKKEWLSSDQPGRTRDWHMPGAFQNLVVDIDKPFVNDFGPIRFPGDHTADGANVYNCRCTMVAKVVGFGKKVAKKAKEVKEFASKKLQDVLGSADFKAFAQTIKNSKARELFDRFSDQLAGIKKSGRGSFYRPASDEVFFQYEKHPEMNKYGILAHEMGHSFDQRVADALNLSFSEVDTINARCMIGSGRTPVLKRAASTSDGFLSAMRQDKDALSVYMTDAAERKKIRDALLAQRNITSGVQDAMDGFFGTQSLKGDGMLPWGHGNAYYNRFFKDRIKYFGSEKELKQIYKEMGFDASNQTKVMMISREYEAASELWANITSAYAVQGDELKAMQKFMPNACKEYERILKEMKK